DEGGTIPAWLATGDMGSATAGDLHELANRGYIHSAPTSCSSFTLTPNTVTQGSGNSATQVTIYNVTGKAPA
ncbi:MAG TPA: hypothetical protein VEY89_10330, partial [Candidatus Dormibacteraeota bacterium]|nr:hypothetical protein [Candidatus Dormibacteraeota bacterium]